MSWVQIAILCVLSFMCLSGLCSAIIIGGGYLSGRNREDDDDIQG